MARWVQAEYESKYRRWRSVPPSTSLTPTPPPTAEAYSRAAGGFDETLQVDEDQELSFRLAEAGHTSCLLLRPSCTTGTWPRPGIHEAQVQDRLLEGARSPPCTPARIITRLAHAPEPKAQMALLALVLLLLAATSFRVLRAKALAIAAGTLLRPLSPSRPVSPTKSRRGPGRAPDERPSGGGATRRHVGGPCAVGPRLLRK